MIRIKTNNLITIRMKNRKEIQINETFVKR